ncbi:MAG: gliding motility-associated C-terminal domain-containing protein [Duncaniella sp.]|nr:gliding motility-associated C-terminal domain-containing protein [Duncaniella sp.]
MKPVSVILFSLLMTAAPAGAAKLSFSGNSMQVLTADAPASSGLDDIYILNDMSGVSATYTASSPSAQVTWYRYSNLGGGYAEIVDGIIRNGNDWTLPAAEGDMGYIIEEGTTRYYCWVVDYSRHPYDVDNLQPGPESDCSRVQLLVDGTGDRITYYSINGQGLTLSRDIKLEYNTLVYNSDNGTYAQTLATETLDYLSPSIHAPAPLCDTSFSLSGDCFLRQWGMESTADSPTVMATAVEARTSAVQTARDNDNEKKDGSGDELGGSAPAEIEFSAAVTDAAVFTEWQISTYPEFDDITMRMRELETTYTFRELGTFYVRFVCADASGECEYYSDIYTVSIGNSSLLCPNAFSPGASEGVNDEWKVSYRSIVSYECHIFNRNGVKMISMTDPSQGWDGKYNGKLVPAGVYYYVIKATGADGKKYNLSGDINIVNYK